MGNLTINNGGVVTNSTNLPNIDLRYGPYGSIQEAYGALENTIAPGLTIGIFENDGITEYIVNDKYQLTPKLKLKTINNQPIIGEGNITIQDGGGSGTSDYEQLTNKPKINNIELVGNVSLSEFGSVGVTTQQYFTDNQKEIARTNIGAQEDIPEMQDKFPVVAALNDRVAISAEVGGVSNLRSMGYKVLKASVEGDSTTSFQEQLAPTVDGTAIPITNTVFEVKDYFDLGGDIFTMPANSKLKIEGGKIDNGTLALNNCQIEATNGWIGENLSISGTTKSEVFADWFSDKSDSDKIEKALYYFVNISLYPRTYTIDKPIVITNNFAIRGYSIGDFFGTNYGNIKTARRTTLRATDTDSSHIDCILDVRGYYAVDDGSHPVHTPSIPRTSSNTAKFISANITEVAFVGSRRSDGIWWSTPSGPSRPICFINCTITLLRRGINIWGSDADNSTNFGDSYFNGCSITANHWGIYATGRHAVSNMNIVSCLIEANHTDSKDESGHWTNGGGLYMWDNSYYPLFGCLNIQNSEFEGQPYGVYLKASSALITFNQNYFEYSGGQTNVITGDSTDSTKVILNVGTVTNASLMSFNLTKCTISSPNEYGDNNLITYKMSCVRVDGNLIGKLNLGDSTPKAVAIPYDSSNISLVSNDDIITRYTGRTSSNAPYFTSYINSIVEGFPSFCKITSTSTDARPTGYQSNLTLSAGTYRVIFYYKTNTDGNYIQVLGNDVILPATGNKLHLCNILVNYSEDTDPAGSAIFKKQISSGYFYVSRPVLVKSSSTGFIGYNLYDNQANRTNITENLKNGDVFYAGGRYYSYNGVRWVDSNGFPIKALNGLTSGRPTFTAEEIDSFLNYTDGYIRCNLDWYSYYDRSIAQFIKPKFRVTPGDSLVNITGAKSGTTKEVNNTLESGKTYTIYITDSSSIAYTYVIFHSTSENITEGIIQYDVTVKNETSGSGSKRWKVIQAPDPTQYPYITLKTNSSTNTNCYFYEPTINWVDYNNKTANLLSGPTTSRPDDLTSLDAGFIYFDTTISKNICWNGTDWTDMMGEPIEIQVSDTTYTISSLVGNKVYTFTNPLTSLTITAYGDTTLETLMYFTAGTNFTFNVPSDSRYIIEEPVFNTGVDYIVSIQNKIIVVGEIV